MGAAVPAELRPDLDGLLQRLKDRRDVAHREMVAVLRSERTAALLSGWRVFLDGLEGTPTKDRPDAKRPIAELAGKRIRRVYHRTMRMGDEIAAGSPAGDYHELRKQGKELRYLLELFGMPLFGEEVVKPMTKTLKGVQDVLGRHQDREVQEAELRQLSEPAAADAGTVPVSPVLANLLMAWLEKDKLATRAAFPERFGPLASKELRDIVKRVFR